MIEFIISSFINKFIEEIEQAINKQASMGKKMIPLDDLRFVYLGCLLCNVKHISWSYEKEFRCTMASNASGMPYIDAVPSEIYIGMNCTTSNEKKLREIGCQLGIPVHKMGWDNSSSNYKLVIID